MSAYFTYQQAIVRHVPDSFSQCLKQEIPDVPLSVAESQKQHDLYIDLLKSIGLKISVLPADESFPDCCFVEDTAVIIGQTAAISYLGAKARVGEELCVSETLTQCGIQTKKIKRPGTVDGGDVLYTGTHLIVGLSLRTNESGAQQLAEIFSDVPVVTVPVSGTLHLKSVMSAFDKRTLLFSKTFASQTILSKLQEKMEIKSHFSIIELPDEEAANVLSINSTVIMQAGFPESESILKKLCQERGMELKVLRMSEFFKADGALTCCSLIF